MNTKTATKKELIEEIRKLRMQHEDVVAQRISANLRTDEAERRVIQITKEAMQTIQKRDAALHRMKLLISGMTAATANPESTILIPALVFSEDNEEG